MRAYTTLEEKLKKLSLTFCMTSVEHGMVWLLQMQGQSKHLHIIRDTVLYAVRAFFHQFAVFSDRLLWNQRIRICRMQCRTLAFCCCFFKHKSPYSLSACLIMILLVLRSQMVQVVDSGTPSLTFSANNLKQICLQERMEERSAMYINLNS